jgi:N-acetylglucosamine-6-phosphate deacetylase
LNNNDFQENGAILIGINLEGPFIDPKKAGVHLIENIRE